MNAADQFQALLSTKPKTKQIAVYNVSEEKRKLDAERARRAGKKAKQNLVEFVKQAWHILEPGTRLRWNWHLDVVCNHVQKMYEELGRAYADESYVMKARNLMINVPPRSLKSKIVSVFGPAWAWLHWPWLKIRCLSSNKQVTGRDSRECREVIGSKWYQDTFTPEWQIGVKTEAGKALPDGVLEFSNTARGTQIRSPFGGRITGSGTHVIIVDDPHDAEEANSDVKRQAVIDKWDIAIENRVEDPTRHVRIGIMQRLHEADWAGHCLAKGDWVHVKIPQEFEAEQAQPKNVFGWQDPRTEDRELLFPDWFPASYIAQEKVKRGSYGYAGQHQQNPAPLDGGMFKRIWWNWCRPDGEPHGLHPRPLQCLSRADAPAIGLPRFDRRIISIDAAFKKLDTGSAVSMLVVGGAGMKRFVIDNTTKPLTFTETCDEILRLHKRYPMATRILIEAKANGSAIVDTLMPKIPGIIEIEPEGGKESRAFAITAEVEAGNVYLMDGAAWVESFIHELSIFPNGKRDDQVDSLSQALIYMTGSNDVYRGMMLGSSL